MAKFMVIDEIWAEQPRTTETEVIPGDMPAKCREVIADSLEAAQAQYPDFVVMSLAEYRAYKAAKDSEYQTELSELRRREALNNEKSLAGFWQRMWLSIKPYHDADGA